jgi:hypothetical protein
MRRHEDGVGRILCDHQFSDDGRTTDVVAGALVPAPQPLSHPAISVTMSAVPVLFSWLPREPRFAL